MYPFVEKRAEAFISSNFLFFYLLKIPLKFKFHLNGNRWVFLAAI